MLSVKEFTLATVHPLLLPCLAPCMLAQSLSVMLELWLLP